MKPSMKRLDLVTNFSRNIVMEFKEGAAQKIKFSIKSSSLNMTKETI